MADKVRVAVVGLGFGAEFVPLYQKHPDAECYAICQRSEDRLNEIGDLFGVERRFTKFEDLLGVGYARIEQVAELPEGEVVEVEVFDARDKYQRCSRSWKRRPDVGSDSEYPDLSARDAAVMKQLAEA